ncbi:hypothetical protein ACSQ67_008876 [Phaseolus vulgaris]
MYVLGPGRGRKEAQEEVVRTGMGVGYSGRGPVILCWTMDPSGRREFEPEEDRGEHEERERILCGNSGTIRML